MRVLFAVCSWGLGHITRSLPLIKKLSLENEIYLISHGRSLLFAKKNLKNNINIKFIDIPDYPLPYTENPNLFLPKFGLYIPKIIYKIKKEHEKIEKIVDKKKINLIVSDNRYGVYSKVPSYIIIHQLKYLAPLKLTPLTEFFNSLFQKKFKKIIVPDFPKFEDSLAGELSHNTKFFRKKKIVYIGNLSDFKKKNLKKDIDIFFSVSGPEPQRLVFEKIILNQVEDLNKKIVIGLGMPEKRYKKEKNNLKIYSYLPREKRENILNRSKLIVTRSGYSTIMDLAELEKKALLVPTKNQTEQEYLARFHFKQSNCYFKNQEKINLVEDLSKADKYKGLKTKWKTKKSLEIFLKAIYN
jgi:uncharacterized protein (TIGR00661 family)